MSQNVGGIVSHKSSSPLNGFFFFDICAMNPYQKNQSELRANTRSDS